MHKTKTTKLIALALLALPVTAASGLAHAAGLFSSEESVSMKGNVERFLLNPEGRVDGFLLSDGTQVNFPPHLAAALTAAVAKGDPITLQGIRHSKTLVKADTITNEKSKVVVKDEGPGKGPKPPKPPRPGEKGESMKEAKAEGKVDRLLTGPRGEVNGLILSDGTILRIPPHLAEKQNPKVGSALKANGYGTENEFGKVIQVTEFTVN